jgi:hypothetical protein
LRNFKHQSRSEPAVKKDNGMEHLQAAAIASPQAFARPLDAFRDAQIVA